jgi:hypothetical protein
MLGTYGFTMIGEHHALGHHAHHELQHAVVVEDGEHRGHEDDGGQRGEREHEAAREHLGHDRRIGQAPEHELRARVRELEETLHAVRDAAEEHVARPYAPHLELQDEKREQHLQREAPTHRTPVDRAQVGRERGHDGDETDDPQRSRDARSCGVADDVGEHRQAQGEQDGGQAKATLGRLREGHRVAARRGGRDGRCSH